MARPLIPIAEARRIVLDAVIPLEPETVEVQDALGRVLAGDLHAQSDVPPFRCSAMDGYAIVCGPADRTLSIVGESRAGSPAGVGPREGEAVRISTGAAVPAGATAVIPQEQTAPAEGGASIVTAAETRDGENIRRAGEDMAAGTQVLSAGSRLSPVGLGAAVAAGAGAVEVSRRPRVAVLCTGDELKGPGEPLGPGEIHNSNAPMLSGLARIAGARAADALRIPDDRDATREAVDRALTGSDVVLISGGVSVGPHDHVKPVLADLGVQELFWSVALQPGKPTWFGRLENGPLVFGLPGNPVSSVVTFALFVSPALAALQGGSAPRPPLPEVPLAVAVTANPRREQALRIRLVPGPEGPRALPNGGQGSHMLTSLIGADALAMIPTGNGDLPAGTVVALEALPIGPG